MPRSSTSWNPSMGMSNFRSRWSPKTYELREFLARNSVPYQWLDPETADRDAEVKHLVESLNGDVKFPISVVSQDVRTPRISSPQLRPLPVARPRNRRSRCRGQAPRGIPQWGCQISDLGGLPRRTNSANF